MSVSQTSTLSEPKGADKIPLGTLAYFRARLKQRIYNLVIKEFKKSGTSQADLARRLDKEPAQLSRLLSGPGNMTTDTVSDLLFAISGGELDLSIGYPLASRGKPGVFGLKDDLAQVSEIIPSPPKESTPRTEANPALIDALKEQSRPRIAA